MLQVLFWVDWHFVWGYVALKCISFTNGLHIRKRRSRVINKLWKIAKKALPGRTNFKHLHNLVPLQACDQSRRHGGFCGISLPNNAPSPPTWNVKHDKSMEFYQFLQCQAPLLKTFCRRFCKWRDSPSHLKRQVRAISHENVIWKFCLNSKRVHFIGGNTPFKKFGVNLKCMLSVRCLVQVRRWNCSNLIWWK